MLAAALMRSIRYCDIDSARPGPRTNILIFLAKPDRYTAACPAELPPPTKTPSSLRQSRASIGEAQYHTPRPSKSLTLERDSRRYLAPAATTTERASTFRPSVKCRARGV